MKSRFDQGHYWYTRDSESLIAEMGTEHLYNAYSMYGLHPERILPTLLWDFDNPERYNIRAFATAWSADRAEASVAYRSARVASTMSLDALITYVYGSELMQALAEELDRRGVDLTETNKNLGVSQ